jgi:hypothetical protein
VVKRMICLYVLRWVGSTPTGAFIPLLCTGREGSRRFYDLRPRSSFSQMTLSHYPPLPFSASKAFEPSGLLSPPLIVRVNDSDVLLTLRIHDIWKVLKTPETAMLAIRPQATTAHLRGRLELEVEMT